MRINKRLLLVVTFILLARQANAQRIPDEDVMKLSVDEIFSRDLTVFSPTKREQSIREVSSATFVINSKEIQRSGAKNIPDLLRLVPGMQVAQINSHEWAISVRGFNEVFANKLLVMLDNTPVETLTFNGVFWSVVDYPLDLIERIEVVRGPGAAVWGGRAVNGIVNIITKPSTTEDTGAITLDAGTEDQSVYTRRKVEFSDVGALEMFIKLSRHDESDEVGGGGAEDEWNRMTIGARSDITLSDRDELRILATGVRTEEDFQVNLAVPTPALVEPNKDQREHIRGSLAFLWNHTFNLDSVLSLELTNYAERREDLIFSLDVLNSDIELRHRYKAKNHDIIYGTNVRLYRDNFDGSNTIDFTPDNRSLEFYRAFIHDDISLSDSLIFTAGARFEHNSLVGTEILPTARMLWHATDNVALWGATTLTTGSPSRVNDDIQLNVSSLIDPATGLPVLVQIRGDRNTESEEHFAYEFGVHADITETMYVDIATFYSRYNNLASREQGTPEPQLFDPSIPPHVILPLTYMNNINGDSYGAEFAFWWEMSNQVSFSGSYTFINIEAEGDNSGDQIAFDFIENEPTHSASLLFHYDPVENWQFDLIGRYVDRLPNTNVDSYLDADFQITWLPRTKHRVSLLGRNLLDSSHVEFVDFTFQGPISEIERSVNIAYTYEF